MDDRYRNLPPSFGNRRPGDSSWPDNDPEGAYEDDFGYSRRSRQPGGRLSEGDWADPAGYPAYRGHPAARGGADADQDRSGEPYGHTAYLRGWDSPRRAYEDPTRAPGWGRFTPPHDGRGRYRRSPGPYYGDARRDVRGGWADPADSDWRADRAAVPHRAGEHRGKGPRGYRRSDARIHQELCDRLADDPRIDASGMEVTVKDGEVTLDGTVESRVDRRRAEDCAEEVSGVAHVQNNLRRRPAAVQTRSESGSDATLRR